MSRLLLDRLGWQDELRIRGSVEEPGWIYRHGSNWNRVFKMRGWMRRLRRRISVSL